MTRYVSYSGGFDLCTTLNKAQDTTYHKVRSTSHNGERAIPGCGDTSVPVRYAVISSGTCPPDKNHSRGRPRYWMQYGKIGRASCREECRSRWSADPLKKKIVS